MGGARPRGRRALPRGRRPGDPDPLDRDDELPRGHAARRGHRGAARDARLLAAPARGDGRLRGRVPGQVVPAATCARSRRSPTCSATRATSTWRSSASSGLLSGMRADERAGHRGPDRPLPRTSGPPRTRASRPSSSASTRRGFERRLVDYVAKHTGVRLAKLKPAAAGGLMAKPRPVTGLDPDRRLRPNARRILAVRIDEVYSYDGVVADPANVTELHDMRIACKRLRYLLEIFAHRLRRRPRALHRPRCSGLQDLLGDIHDCDVQIPMLEDHLAWLSAREGGAARRLVAEAATARPAALGAALRGRLPRVRQQARGRPPRRRAPRRPRPHRPPPPRARRALRASSSTSGAASRPSASAPGSRPRSASTAMPERLALLGDVHANGVALRAVLEAIAEAGITRRRLHRRPRDARRRPRGLRRRPARPGLALRDGQHRPQGRQPPGAPGGPPQGQAGRLPGLDHQPAHRPRASPSWPGCPWCGG